MNINTSAPLVGASGFTCPPGYDIEVFFSLPEEMQQEVVAQHSIGNTEASIRDLTAAAGFDFGEFMLLPEDIRQELLEQARRDQAALTSAATEMFALPDPVTPPPFISPPTPPAPAPAPKEEPHVSSSIYECTTKARNIPKSALYVVKSFVGYDFPAVSSSSDSSDITYAVPFHLYSGGTVAELLPLALAKVNTPAAVETAAEKSTDPIAKEDSQPAAVVLCVGTLNISNNADFELRKHLSIAGISRGRKDLIVIDPGWSEIHIDSRGSANLNIRHFRSIHHIWAGLPWRERRPERGKLHYGKPHVESFMEFDAYGDIARALEDFENGVLYEFPDGCDRNSMPDTPSNERFTLQKGPSCSNSIEFIEKATGAIFSTKRVPVAPRWPQEMSFVQELTAACLNWCSAGREVVFINGFWFAGRYHADLELCKEGSGGERIRLGRREARNDFNLENDHLEGCSYLLPFVREMHTSHPDLFSYCVQGKGGKIHTVGASSLIERIDTATSNEKDGDDGVGVGFGVSIGDGGKDSVAVSEPNQK